jgi:hypothetical protein
MYLGSTCVSSINATPFDGTLNGPSQLVASCACAGEKLAPLGQLNSPSHAVLVAGGRDG